MSEPMPIPSDLNGLSSGSQANAEKQAQDAAERQERQEGLLKSILTSDAYERLLRIKLVKPEKYAEVGNLLLQLASRGSLTEKVGEEKLKQMLGSIGDGDKGKTTKITFQRKKYGDEDDEEEYDL